MLKANNIIIFSKKCIMFIILVFSIFFLTLYCIILFPVMVYSRKTGIFLMNLVSYILWRIFSVIFHINNKIEYKINGLEYIGVKENCIYISNHIGSFDFIFINEIADRFNMMAFSKYLVKDSIKYMFPMSFTYFLGFIITKRKFNSDFKSIKNSLDILKNSKQPYNIVIYPEGTRFNEKKKKLSQDFCKERKKPLLYNVLYPRIKGFDLICNLLKNEISHIIDVTIICKFEKIPTFIEFLFGYKIKKYIIKVDVYTMNNIIENKNILVDIFYKKDNYISKFKIKHNSY